MLYPLHFAHLKPSDFRAALSLTVLSGQLLSAKNSFSHCKIRTASELITVLESWWRICWWIVKFSKKVRRGPLSVRLLKRCILKIFQLITIIVRSTWYVMWCLWCHYIEINRLKITFILALLLPFVVSSNSLPRWMLYTSLTSAHNGTSWCIYIYIYI